MRIWAPPTPDESLRGSHTSDGLSPSKLFPVIPLNSQWEIQIKINWKLCQILVDTRATFSILSLTFIKQHVPWNKKEVSIVGVSNKVQREFLNQYK